MEFIKRELNTSGLSFTSVHSLIRLHTIVIATLYTTLTALIACTEVKVRSEKCAVAGLSVKIRFIS